MNKRPREPGETSFPDIEEVDEQWKDPDDPDLFLREASCDGEPSDITAPEEKRQETGVSP